MRGSVAGPASPVQSLTTQQRSDSSNGAFKSDRSVCVSTAVLSDDPLILYSRFSVAGRTSVTGRVPSVDGRPATERVDRGITELQARVWSTDAGVH